MRGDSSDETSGTLIKEINQNLGRKGKDPLPNHHSKRKGGGRGKRGMRLYVG